MAQERIELRFSPRDPDEMTVIAALGALDNDYGAKSRFLRERLLKGYVVIRRELEGLLRQEDPMAALDHHPLAMDSRHYRVLKVLLSARMHGREEVPAATDLPACAEIAGVKREN